MNILPAHDLTLTIDANSYNYLMSYIITKKIPHGLNINRMDEFQEITDRNKIAMNTFIRTEYEQCTYSEFSKQWLKRKNITNKVVEVPIVNLPKKIQSSLRDHYGFDIHDSDRKYLGTSYNTNSKLLITHNSEHFKRSHRTKGRMPMDKYLNKELGILITYIDECCDYMDNYLPPTINLIASTIES